VWFQWLLGFVSFLLPFCRQSVRAFVLPIHTFFGVVIFCFAVATAMMGFTEKLIWALYVAACCVVYYSCVTLYGDNAVNAVEENSGVSMHAY